MTTHTKKQYLTIDVAKSSLVANLYGLNIIRKVPNNASGIKTLIQLSKEHHVDCVVLEPTGGYEKTALMLFCQAGITIHLAHTNAVKHFAIACKMSAKTDKIDTNILGAWATQMDVDANYTFSESLAELKELMSLRQQLVDAKTQLESSQDKNISKNSLRLLKKVINEHKKNIKNLEKEIHSIIKKQDHLWRLYKIITSLKGAGKITAYTLIAFMPELGALSKAKIAALAGLAPHPKQSGKCMDKHYISGGRKIVRNCLYMTAVSAISHNKDLKPIYETLRFKKGKAFKVAIVAIMRKIIVMINALVKNNKTYEQFL